VAISDSSQCETTCNTCNGCPTDLYNGIEGCNNLVGPPPESISADGDYAGSATKLGPAALTGVQGLTLSQTRRRTERCRKASCRTTKDRREDDDDDGLAKRCLKSGLNSCTDTRVCSRRLTQAKLPSQESRSEAGGVHGATGPQEEHAQLVGPRNVALVLWQLPGDGIAFNAKLRIHSGFERAQRTQKAGLALDSRVTDILTAGGGHALKIPSLFVRHRGPSFKGPEGCGEG
jgi:hypothetical protein